MRGCGAEEIPSGVNRKEMYRLVNIVCYLIETQTYTVFPRTNKRQGAYLKFRLKGWAVIGRRALNPGGRLLSSPVGNQVIYLSPIIQFTHRVINKVAIETGFPCIPTIKDINRGGVGGGACLIFWPRGWALVFEELR